MDEGTPTPLRAGEPAIGTTTMVAGELPIADTPSRARASLTDLGVLVATAHEALVAYNRWRLAPVVGSLLDPLQDAMDELALALYGEPEQ